MPSLSQVWIYIIKERKFTLATDSRLDLDVIDLSSYIALLPVKAIGTTKNGIFFPWKILTALIPQDGQNGKLSNLKNKEIFPMWQELWMILG